VGFVHFLVFPKTKRNVEGPHLRAMKPTEICGME